jgi:hypothetical protein
VQDISSLADPGDSITAATRYLRRAGAGTAHERDLRRLDGVNRFGPSACTQL